MLQQRKSYRDGYRDIEMENPESIELFFVGMVD